MGCSSSSSGGSSADKGDVSDLPTLLGDKLLTKDGEQTTAEVLGGATAVGLYFSAHWCPPCRGFTPKLAEWYTDTFKDMGMKIVFVSSDQSEEQFKEYFGEMPWAALPFSNKAKKDELSRRFDVQGIPAFIILGPQGKLYTKDGRQEVSNDPKGERYPWSPDAAKGQGLLQVLGSEIVEKVAGKPIGLYFSAHWCPPCRGFTPQLATWYKEGLSEKLEIVFVSSDKDQAAFDEYYKEMPWLALPFDKREEKDKLATACGVQGIPSLTILNADGTVLTHDGRGKATQDPKGEKFPAGWA